MPDENNDTNTVKLKEHLEKRIHELDLRTGIKFESIDMKLHVASREIDRRLAELNKLREEVTSDRGQFVQREAHEIWKDLLTQDLSQIKQELASGRARTITWTAAISLFLIVVSIVIKLWK